MSTAIAIPGTGKSLGEDGVFIVAEIGKGFIQSKEDRPIEEYLQNAKDLVDAAVETGVDAVKFQTHEIEDEVLNIDFTSPHFKGSDRYSWVTRNMEATPTEGFWTPLIAHCKKRNILFFSTPMSRKAAMKLEEFGVPLWKVGSGDVRDYVMLDYLIETKKPIIISTGMVSLKELDDVIEYITSKGSPLAVLYCVSKYPCPHDYFNLSTIAYLREKYPHVVIGFSDHSVGNNDVDFAAVTLGARIIEKHFSFSRDLWGSDHKASVTPEEMRELVDGVRSKKYTEVDHTPFYGVRDRELEGANNQFRPYYYKSLMAGMDIKEGTVLTKEMIFAMRPIMLAGGLPSDQLHDILGRRTTKYLSKYSPIVEEVLE
jgi:sialic acid synthase SpsE